MATDEERLAVARATIHLDGLPLGETATVDLDHPYVAMCVSSGYLVIERMVAPEETARVG